MPREIPPKVAWLVIGVAVIVAAGLLLWWFFASDNPVAGGKVEVIPPGYNPMTGRQLK
jgi:hypothetical protein